MFRSIFVLLALLTATCSAPVPNQEEAPPPAEAALPALGVDDIVATLSFRARDEQAFEVTLRSPAGAERAQELYGREWRLEGELDRGLFRLDRLPSRDVSDYREAYDLGDAYRWELRPDLHYGQRMYASSAYFPMADGAEFAVRITSGGLVSSPLNEAAARAVESYQN